MNIIPSPHLFSTHKWNLGPGFVWTVVSCRRVCPGVVWAFSHTRSSPSCLGSGDPRGNGQESPHAAFSNYSAAQRGHIMECAIGFRIWAPACRLQNSILRNCFGPAWYYHPSLPLGNQVWWLVHGDWQGTWGQNIIYFIFNHVKDVDTSRYSVPMPSRNTGMKKPTLYQCTFRYVARLDMMA